MVPSEGLDHADAVEGRNQDVVGHAPGRRGRWLVGERPNVDNQSTPDANQGGSDPIGEAEAPEQQDDPTSAGDEAVAEPTLRMRRPRILRPWEALRDLDRQWEDPTPLAESTKAITALALTTDGDPRGWNYLEALTGASLDETVAACEAWLEAQLAADAAVLGRALRPRVDLVPSGRLWFVVRTVADIIIVIDGPGFLTPRAAAVAASRRYEAELLGALERVGDSDNPLVDHAPEDADTAGATESGVVPPSTESPTSESGA